jgi:hypothetical protein
LQKQFKKLRERGRQRIRRRLELERSRMEQSFLEKMIRRKAEEAKSPNHKHKPNARHFGTLPARHTHGGPLPLNVMSKLKPNPNIPVSPGGARRFGNSGNTLSVPGEEPPPSASSTTPSPATAPTTIPYRRQRALSQPHIDYIPSAPVTVNKPSVPPPSTPQQPVAVMASPARGSLRPGALRGLMVATSPSHLQSSSAAATSTSNVVATTSSDAAQQHGPPSHYHVPSSSHRHILGAATGPMIAGSQSHRLSIPEHAPLNDPRALSRLRVTDSALSSATSSPTNASMISPSSPNRGGTSGGVGGVIGRYPRRPSMMGSNNTTHESHQQQLQHLIQQQQHQQHHPQHQQHHDQSQQGAQSRRPSINRPSSRQTHSSNRPPLSRHNSNEEKVDETTHEHAAHRATSAHTNSASHSDNSDNDHNDQHHRRSRHHYNSVPMKTEAEMEAEWRRRYELEREAKDLAERERLRVEKEKEENKQREQWTIKASAVIEMPEVTLTEYQTKHDAMRRILAELVLAANNPLAHTSARTAAAAALLASPTPPPFIVASSSSSSASSTSSTQSQPPMTAMLPYPYAMYQGFPGMPPYPISYDYSGLGPSPNQSNRVLPPHPHGHSNLLPSMPNTPMAFHQMHPFAHHAAIAQQQASMVAAAAALTHSSTLTANLNGNTNEVLESTSRSQMSPLIGGRSPLPSHASTPNNNVSANSNINGDTSDTTPTSSILGVGGASGLVPTTRPATADGSTMNGMDRSTASIDQPLLFDTDTTASTTSPHTSDDNFIHHPMDSSNHGGNNNTSPLQVSSSLSVDTATPNVRQVRRLPALSGMQPLHHATNNGIDEFGSMMNASASLPSFGYQQQRRIAGPSPARAQPTRLITASAFGAMSTPTSTPLQQQPHHQPRSTVVPSRQRVPPSSPRSMSTTPIIPTLRLSNLNGATQVSASSLSSSMDHDDYDTDNEPWIDPLSARSMAGAQRAAAGIKGSSFVEPLARPDHSRSLAASSSLRRVIGTGNNNNKNSNGLSIADTLTAVTATALEQAMVGPPSSPSYGIMTSSSSPMPHYTNPSKWAPSSLSLHHPTNTHAHPR